MTKVVIPDPQPDGPCGLEILAPQRAHGQVKGTVHEVWAYV
jgi:hypothetical protein